MRRHGNRAKIDKDVRKEGKEERKYEKREETQKWGREK